MTTSNSDNLRGGDGSIRHVDDASRPLDNIGRSVAASTRTQAREQLDRGRQSAAGAAQQVATALDETASTLSKREQETFAEAASAMAARLSHLSDSLRTRSLDELLQEARESARRNPAAFIGASVAVGIAMSRFFMASDEIRAGGNHG